MVVNYIAETNAFFRFVIDEEPSGNAQLLWHALMHLFNDHGSGSEWPETMEISNKRLLSLLPFSEDTLAKAREELTDFGRIAYTAGSRKGRPVYSICLFASEISTGDVQNSGFSTMPEDLPEVMPQITPQITPQINPQISGDSAEQYQTETHTHTHMREDDDYCGRKKGARARDPIMTIVQDPSDERTDELYAAWHEFISPQTPSAESVRDMIQIARSIGTQPGMIREAIRNAARYNAVAPMQYAAMTLCDWAEAGYLTPEDVEEAQVLRIQARSAGRFDISQPLAAYR